MYSKGSCIWSIYFKTTPINGIKRSRKEKFIALISRHFDFNLTEIFVLTENVRKCWLGVNLKMFWNYCTTFFRTFIFKYTVFPNFFALLRDKKCLFSIPKRKKLIKTYLREKIISRIMLNRFDQIWVCCICITI